MGERDTLATGLRDEGEHRLASFTSEELVAVAADSPVQGLAISDRLAAMGPIPLTAALSAALRGLVARGFAHPEAAASTPGGPPRADRRLQEVLDTLGEAPGAGARGAGETVSVPLSGDLAVVVALRRAPAVVVLVSEPSRSDLAVRGPLAHRRTDAILHAFTGDGDRLAGFLEERRSTFGIHAFVLRSLEQETAFLAAALERRAHEPLGATPAGPCETALEVAAPGQNRRDAIRLLVTFDPAPGGDRVTISQPGRDATPTGETLPAARLAGRLVAWLQDLWQARGRLAQGSTTSPSRSAANS